MQIAQKLKELRLDRDLRQSDIATLCNYYGVSADYVLGLPKGLNWPR